MFALLKMNLFYFAFIPVVLYLCPACKSQGITCTKQNLKSGVISDSVYLYSQNEYTKCWLIEVPQETYVRLHFKELKLQNSCPVSYVIITDVGTNENYTFCHSNSDLKPITALSDVNITLRNSRVSYHVSLSFKLEYIIEDLICAQKNHFRCSNYSCIHQYQVCNGVKDCSDGSDEIGCEKGVLVVKGLNISRENTITWLKNQQSSWGRNTHRAITALYLSQGASFRGHNLEEELIVKQLELQTTVALLRNSTDPLSVSELSMFVNALTVTCHNPRRFYGYDLLQILGERVSSTKPLSPGAYLTLCNSNWTVSELDVRNLLKLLHKHSKYPFLVDVQAVTVMALTCIKKKTNFGNIKDASKIYDTAIEKFITGQLSDGSFGNVYTTALVTQALISSGQENNKQWNVTSTVLYLMRQLNSSSVDFLSASLALPIFNSRSLADIATVDCTNSSRIQVDDEEISDVTNKLGGKINIQYSLYIGDQKDVIHTVFLRMPENSSAFDVLRVAQVADPKYKFLHRDVSGHVYVYEIAGITNDPEAGKFWLLYTGNQYFNGTVKHHIESPEEIIIGDAQHLIMWYKTAHI